MFAISITVIPNTAFILTDSFKRKLENIVVKTTLKKSNGATRAILPRLKTHINKIFAKSNTIVITVKNKSLFKLISCCFIRT